MKQALVWAMLGLVTLGSASALADSAPSRFVEGEHYAALPEPVKTRNAQRIEVVEVFSYLCPHCYQFEPLIGAWKAANTGSDVDFHRVPATWSPDYKLLGQNYYALESLGVTEQMHLPLFRALHVDRQPLITPKALAGFYADRGLASADFLKMMDSFGVRAQTQNAIALARLYQVSSVPCLVVNGRYRVDGRMAGSNQGMLDVVDFLVQKERDRLGMTTQVSSAAATAQ